MRIISRICRFLETPEVVLFDQLSWKMVKYNYIPRELRTRLLFVPTHYDS